MYKKSEVWHEQKFLKIEFYFGYKKSRLNRPLIKVFFFFERTAPLSSTLAYRPFQFGNSIVDEHRIIGNKFLKLTFLFVAINH